LQQEDLDSRDLESTCKPPVWSTQAQLSLKSLQNITKIRNFVDKILSIFKVHQQSTAFRCLFFDILLCHFCGAILYLLLNNHVIFIVLFRV
jgi:hypothetical protein